MSHSPPVSNARFTLPFLISYPSHPYLRHPSPFSTTTSRGFSNPQEGEMATTTSSVTINVSSRLIPSIAIPITNSKRKKTKFYGELRQLWVEINSHCERLHLLDSTTRVLSACIECKITPYGMVPLDIDGLENADEYVMQLVVSILFCMFHL
jgi:hypothetical protein